jgi:hypothetical protein
LQYILYTNAGNPLGSILVQSNSAVIPFNPATMQLGVTYYTATIAGNNLNGNVNFNDPCFDVSNAAQVIWRPAPTVILSLANPNLCAGTCKTLTATFSGAPPFTLAYTSTAGTGTQTFPGNTGTFQVCVPAGAAAGNLVVQATTVTDAFCTCN